MLTRYFDGGRHAFDIEMMVLLRCAKALTLYVCMFCVCHSVFASEVPAAALKDDRGRVIEGVPKPERVVSLLPSLTEIVCSLGACHKLVGVDRFSNWPVSLQSSVPTLGGGLDPNIEAIVALKPDVVLLSNAGRTAQRLEALGVRTVVLEQQKQADVLRALHSIGLLLGLPAERAQQEWDRIQQGIDAAAKTLPEHVRGARVYFEVSRGPYVAGPHSFIGELLSQLTVSNVVPSELGPFPRLNPEFILRTRPDVILMGSESMQSAYSYPGWHTLDAVVQQRICHFDTQASDVIIRPGPRMDEAARIIASCLKEKAPARAH